MNHYNSVYPAFISPFVFHRQRIQEFSITDITSQTQSKILRLSVEIKIIVNIEEARDRKTWRLKTNREVAKEVEEVTIPQTKITFNV